MVPFEINPEVLDDEEIIYRPLATNQFTEEDNLPLKNEGPIPWAYGAV
jgi:hypothetical protein